MYKNYIFDFGNVLVRFCPIELTKCVVKDEEDAKLITDVIFNPIYWEKLDSGEVTDSRARERIVNSLPKELAEAGGEVFDNWIKNMPPIYEMIEVVEKLKADGKKLYILSNISKGFAEKYQDYPWIKELFSKFDGLVFSGVVGMIKPDKRIFEYILNKYHLNAEECLFIDDNENNVLSAKKVGINTYLFDGDVEKIKEFLWKV